MAEEQVLIPTGAPESPPFTNAFVVHHNLGVVTIYMMRLPPYFTEQQRLGYLNAKELAAPVVASATLTAESARDLLRVLTEVVPKATGA